MSLLVVTQMSNLFPSATAIKLFFSFVFFLFLPLKQRKRNDFSALIRKENGFQEIIFSNFCFMSHDNRSLDHALKIITMYG